ncbi:MAG: DUF1588 domain-containing protein [Planctomycetota bacterium]|nr:DUF1588 domain-containing protein [Planctomycetota bacterium]
MIQRLVIIFLFLPGVARFGCAQGQLDAEGTFEIVQDRCLDCHGTDGEAGINLEHLFQRDQSPNQDEMELWIRVEKVVSEGKMPPPQEEPLVAGGRQAILASFNNAFVLRKGKEHVGQTVLRRLTRYEIQNSLADVLAVQLQPPYVVSSEQIGLNLSTIEQILPDDLRGESGFSNDAHRLSETRIPFEKFIACVDYALRIFDQDDTAREKLTGFRKADADFSPDQVKRILSGFLDRSWRGQVSEIDLQKIFKVWKDRRLAGESPGKALLHAMKIALLSPAFLYRMEKSRNAVQPYAVEAKELAVRLSYFLWSTSPDQALWNAALSGKLETDEQLLQQVHRMLNSKKRISLSENFAGQWLGFDELRTNKNYYRGENWTRGVYDELLFGFDELIRSDRSILEMVDSQWAFLRNRKYGGINVRNLKREGKFGDIFEDRRVRTGLKVERFYAPPQLYEVNNDQFGGLMTSTGIMQLTSAPNRTNPIRRGVWILEKLIGETMHPPENIPPLAESIKKIPKNLPRQPREILKLHTSRPSCVACHQHIDPLGLGLENFSPSGEWRTAYADKSPVHGEGKLPNGKQFASPQQLKNELLAFYGEKIVDNMVRRMLAYASGRKIFPHDRPEIERIKRVLQENDYKMVTLIEQIVLSSQFRMRQDQ